MGDIRTVLVTGASGFLGTAICQKLCVHYRVIGVDVSDSFIAEESYSHYICDITSEDAIQDLAKRLQDEGIELDVVINNAALNPKVLKGGLEKTTSSRIENYGLNGLRREFEVSLVAPVLIAKYLMSLMRPKGPDGLVTSCFVNISSDLGLISPDNRLYRDEKVEPSDQPVKPVGYSIAKSGVLGFSRYMATYKPHHFRSNAICPGGIFNNQGNEFLERIASRIPLERMASIDEIVSAVEFLSSTNSTYINGAELVVDGGRSIW